MKTIKVSASCFCLCFALIAVAVDAAGVAPQGGAKKGKTNQTIEKGRAVYASNCARCHGGDGAGRTTLGEMTEAPSLADARWQSRRSDSRMIASVARGRGQMPAFSKKLSKEEIAATIAYVRTLKR